MAKKGRKAKYSEKTVIFAFRCPGSKLADIKIKIKKILEEYEVLHSAN